MDLVRRADWGAAPAPRRPKAIATPVKSLYLHHSAGRDGGPAVLRQIQSFHQQTRGWNDIAYTWLYSPNSRTWYEGRGPGVAGAHTRGYNQESHAVCVLGNYDLEELPETAVHDLAEWAYWHGGTWGPDQYTPHSAVGQTACPGRNILDVIDVINQRAKMVPTRDWISARVADVYGSYEEWEQQVREADL